MKKNFLKIIVISTLLFMPFCATVFVILQLTTGLDPTPYLSYLAIPVTAQLAYTTALKIAERLTRDKETTITDTIDYEYDMEDFNDDV